MKKIKILLVDDHQIFLDGLQSLLDKEPEMEVVGQADSGEETLRQLALQPVEVVVLDISMPPGMNGIEAAKHIKKQYPATKIILLTMESEGKVIYQAMRMGLHGYVLKNKSKESLVAAIHAVVKGNHYFPPELLLRLIGNEEMPDDDESEVKLTQREIEIICLMKKHPEFTSKEIGEHLFIATTTVEKHQQNAKKKLGFTRNQQLILYAQEKNICTSQ